MTTVPTRSTANRPVQVTAFGALVLFGPYGSEQQRPSIRLQHLGWTDPNLHRILKRGSLESAYGSLANELLIDRDMSHHLRVPGTEGMRRPSAGRSQWTHGRRAPVRGPPSRPFGLDKRGLLMEGAEEGEAACRGRRGGGSASPANKSGSERMSKNRRAAGIVRRPSDGMRRPTSTQYRSLEWSATSNRAWKPRTNQGDWPWSIIPRNRRG